MCITYLVAPYLLHGHDTGTCSADDQLPTPDTSARLDTFHDIQG